MTPAQPHHAQSNAPLVIDRARMHGSGERRGLQRALQHSPIDGLGLGPGEYLLIPQMKVQERLVSGGTNRTFSRGFSKALRDCLEKAELNPAGAVGSGRSVRFSSKPQLAAWLIGEPAASAPYVAGLIADMASAKTVEDWVSRALLPDAPMVAHTARILMARGKLATWIAGLSAPQLGMIAEGLQKSFGVASALHFTTDGNAPSPDPAKPSASRAGSAARQSMSWQVEVLRSQLNAQFANTSLSARHKAIGAALVFLGAIPSAPRGAVLENFIASISLGTFEASKAGEDQQTGSSQPEGFLQTTPPVGRAEPSRSGAAEQPVPDPKASRPSPQSFESSRPDSGDCGANSELAANENSIASEKTVRDHQNWMEEDVAFDSPFCGLLFLTNLLRHLGFVDDFGLYTTGGEGLAPFELIDSVGTAWFGAEYQKSALHRWLNANASRRWTPRAFEHPLLTREEISDASCSIIRDRLHVTVWHREGFPLRDCRMRDGARLPARIAGDLPRQVFATTRILRARPNQKLPRHGKARWMKALALCLEHEMRRRCGEYRLSPDDLRIPGHVRVADGQITIHLSLDTLPFAARLAGLDQNPGWINEEGRSLAFIYT